jgi:hypothetical protein
MIIRVGDMVGGRARRFTRGTGLGARGIGVVEPVLIDQPMIHKKHGLDFVTADRQHAAASRANPGGSAHAPGVASKNALRRQRQKARKLAPVEENTYTRLLREDHAQVPQAGYSVHTSSRRPPHGGGAAAAPRGDVFAFLNRKLGGTEGVSEQSRGGSKSTTTSESEQRAALLVVRDKLASARANATSLRERTQRHAKETAVVVALRKPLEEAHRLVARLEAQERDLDATLRARKHDTMNISASKLF